MTILVGEARNKGIIYKTENCQKQNVISSMIYIYIYGIDILFSYLYKNLPILKSF